MHSRNLSLILAYLIGGSIGIGGNLLIILAILGSKKLRRSKCSVLLCFLGITDFATSISSLIVGLTQLISPTSTQSRFGCLLSAGPMFTGNQMSAMLILLVSLDRLLHLYRPDAYRSIKPIPYYFVCAAVTIAYAAFMMSTPFLIFSSSTVTVNGLQKNSSTSAEIEESQADEWWFEPIPVCKIIHLFSGNPAGSQLYFYVHFLAAAAVLAANLLTMRKLNEMGRQVENGGREAETEGGTGTGTTHEETAFSASAELRKKKLIKSIMVISLVYVGTWVLAVVTSRFSYHFLQFNNDNGNIWWFKAAHMLICLSVQVDNGCNVFIYAYISREYRWEFERWTPDFVLDVMYICFSGLWDDKDIPAIKNDESSPTQNDQHHQNQQQLSHLVIETQQPK